MGGVLGFGFGNWVGDMWCCWGSVTFCHGGIGLIGVGFDRVPICLFI